MLVALAIVSLVSIPAMRAKTAKTFGIGGLPITTNISLANNFNMDEISDIVFRVNDTSLTQTLGPELARRMTEIAGLQQGEYQVADASAAFQEFNNSLVL